MGKITGGALARAATMESAITQWKARPEDDGAVGQVEACVTMAMDNLQVVDEQLHEELVRKLRTSYWVCLDGEWAVESGETV